MTYRVDIVQRVGIDMDDEGEELGDGAALVDLACMTIVMVLPFVPHVGLKIRQCAALLEIEEVVWDTEQGRFRCFAVPMWRQTKKAAEETIDELVESGFRPIAESTTDH